MPREKKVYKYHFIYKTTNILNNKFYIGIHSTNSLDDGYLGSGDRLKSSIRHHGRNNHRREIIEFFCDRDSLVLREIQMIDENTLKDPLCLNLVEGGEGGFPLSDEHIKKFSETGHEALRRKLEDPEFKKSFGDKVKEQNKIKKELGLFKGKDWTGLNHTEESKSKIGAANSIKQSGENNSQFGKYWIYKDDEILRISSNELDNYLALGWNRGKCKKKKKIRYGRRTI